MAAHPTSLSTHAGVRRARAARGRQAGLTMIELLVALVLGLLIAAASVAALIVARQGFKSVDTTSQLRDNARFAAALIQRVAVQAGFENAAYGQITAAKEPGLEGFDNALVGNVSGWTNAPAGLAHASRTSAGCGATDTSCLNGSDILIVRYWGVSRGGAADGTMINCAGISEPEGTERAFSIFHVVRSTTGEPTLACTFRAPPGVPAPYTANTWYTVPLIAGVEGFQVLYGVDTRDNLGATTTDSVADHYLRASELATAPTASPIDNWRRVRTLRIGLVVRGGTPDAIDRAATAAASMPVLGDGFSTAADEGSALTIAADGRLRQRLVFTVHLRNAQFAP
jgi:type IV pilus assembly protein PilW